MRLPILYTAIIAAIVVLDQITKSAAVRYLKPIPTKPLIENVLHLTYVTNYGAAFGMLANQRWIFLAVSTVSIVLMVAYLFSKQITHPLLGVALSCVIGGGIGNMIDRTLMGYVVDFVDFRLINFAVFNVADIFVCVGCGLLFLWLLCFSRFCDADGDCDASNSTDRQTESSEDDHASSR